MTDDIQQRVYDVVRRTFRVPPGTPVGATTTSADVDGWDSLSHAILIMNVETEFGIALPVERVYELEDAGQLVDLVRATLAVTK